MKSENLESHGLITDVLDSSTIPETFVPFVRLKDGKSPLHEFVVVGFCVIFVTKIKNFFLLKTSRHIKIGPVRDCKYDPMYFT